MLDPLYIKKVWPKFRFKKKGSSKKFPMSGAPMSRYAIRAYLRKFLEKRRKNYLFLKELIASADILIEYFIAIGGQIYRVA